MRILVQPLLGGPGRHRAGRPFFRKGEKVNTEDQDDIPGPEPVPFQVLASITTSGFNEVLEIRKLLAEKHAINEALNDWIEQLSSLLHSLEISDTQVSIGLNSENLTVVVRWVAGSGFLLNYYATKEEENDEYRTVALRDASFEDKVLASGNLERLVNKARSELQDQVNRAKQCSGFQTEWVSAKNEEPRVIARKQ